MPSSLRASSISCATGWNLRDTTPTRERNPFAIPARSRRRSSGTWRRCWGRADAREFAGRFLTEPKAQVHFDRPRKALTRTAFVRRGRAEGLALDPATRLAFSGTMFFMNGEAVPVPSAARAALRRLADERRIANPVEAPPAFWDLAHPWHEQGFLHLEGDQR
jgi:hypothetical protein